VTAHWLILSISRSHGVSAIYDAVEALAYPVKCLQYVPAERDSVYAESSCIVVNGPATAIERLQLTRAWKPIGWCDRHVFAASTLVRHWSEYALQQNFQLISLKDLAKEKSRIFSALSIQDQVFARPDAHDKIFDGKLVTLAQFDAWQSQLLNDQIPPETLCLIGQPISIDAEWRIVIRDGKVLTSSSYRVNGRFDKSVPAPSGAIEFAEHVAKAPFPNLPQMYVMDVCQTDGKYGIVEIGSINCSGFYGCDLHAVISAVSELAVSDWKRLQLTNQ